MKEVSAPLLIERTLVSKLTVLVGLSVSFHVMASAALAGGRHKWRLRSVVAEKGNAELHTIHDLSATTDSV